MRIRIYNQFLDVDVTRSSLPDHPAMKPPAHIVMEMQTCGTPPSDGLPLVMEVDKVPGTDLECGRCKGTCISSHGNHNAHQVSKRSSLVAPLERRQ